MKKTFALLALAAVAAIGCSSKDSDTDQVTHECPVASQDAGSDVVDTDASVSDAGDPDAVTPVEQDADTDATVPPAADAAAE